MIQDEEIIKKIVFKEANDSRPKVLFGRVKDLNDGFILVTNQMGDEFTINKNSVVFIRTGDYR